MDAAAYASVVRLVCANLGIEAADNTLIRNITTYYKRLNVKQLSIQHAAQRSLHAAIAQSYVESLKPLADDDGYFKEVEKETSSVIALRKSLLNVSPLLSSKAMHLYVDTRLRETSNYDGSPIMDFVFSLVPRHQFRGKLGDGQLQVPVSPSNVTYLKVGKIVLPYSAALRKRNFSQEITLTFAALRSNGIVARDDTYHFAFTYHTMSDSIVELRPVNEYCKFTTPINHLDDLSLRFNDPLFPIMFCSDRMRALRLDYSSANGQIIFATPHSLESGDVIIVEKLTTNNDAANAAVLELVNDRKRIVVEKISDTVIATNINFTKLVTPDVDAKPAILFHSKIFRFPLEIGYHKL